MQQEAQSGALTVEGQVLHVDYDLDEITVRLESGEERTFNFALFDAGDVYQPDQRFAMTFDALGMPAHVDSADQKRATSLSISGYVESVDMDDQLIWVYLRTEEGWHRKVMPLALFQQEAITRPGEHFILDLAEDGTPVGLRLDEQELEMQLQPAEETKPRWTNRPAAEVEPEG